MQPNTEVSKKKFRLSSLIFQEPDEKVQTSPATVPPQHTVPVPAAAAVVTADPKIKEALEKSLEENCLGGFDYLKFRKSLEQLRGMIADEGTRFKSAFVAAQAMGLTKEKLLETAKHYVNVLNEENRKFQQATTDQTATAVTGMEEKVKKAEEQITTISAEITKLTEQIGELQRSKVDLSSKIAEARARIESTTASFTSIHSSLVQGIEQDMGKITSYL